MTSATTWGCVLDNAVLLVERRGEDKGGGRGLLDVLTGWIVLLSLIPSHLATQNHTGGCSCNMLERRSQT